MVGKEIVLARFGPTVHLQACISGGTIFGKGDQFWLPKSVWETNFGCQNWSGGPRIGRGGPLLGGGERFWCDRTLSIDLDRFSMEFETLLVSFKI